MYEHHTVLDIYICIYRSCLVNEGLSIVIVGCGHKPFKSSHFSSPVSAPKRDQQPHLHNEITPKCLMTLALNK
jgi:hypothetical protein